MVGLLLITHNQIGTALLDTATDMLGMCPLMVEALPVKPDCEPEAMVSRGRALVRDLNHGDGVLVLTDMYGSTPSNIAGRLVDDQVMVVCGVDKGVGIGKAHILRRGYADISHYNVPARFVADEVGRYRAALAAVRQQLESARLQIPRDVPVDILALIDVHLLMTQDSAFSREPVLLIERHRCNAEWALQMQRETLVQAFC